MILISHRGNISGQHPELENRPEYIRIALEAGYDVEVDVWWHHETYWLGHSCPTYECPDYFMDNRKIWCHAKSIQTLNKLISDKYTCFANDNDTYSLTSNRYIWTWQSARLTDRSIVCLPEQWVVISDADNIAGICSDIIENYK